MYDYSGEWAYKISLPKRCLNYYLCCPKCYGIAVFPRLDELGNSLKALNSLMN